MCKSSCATSLSLTLRHKLDKTSYHSITPPCPNELEYKSTCWSVDSPGPNLVRSIIDTKMRPRIPVIAHPSLQSLKSPNQNTISRLVIIGIPHLQRDSILSKLVVISIGNHPIALLHYMVLYVGGRVGKKVLNRVSSDLSSYCDDYIC